jgi:hypothetical protein
MEVRKLAFSFATFLECKMPKSWESTSAAGKDWFGSFIKRNPSLSIRFAFVNASLFSIS